MKKLFLILISLFILSHNYTYPQYPTYFIVSKKGDGDYKTIQEAINNCKSFPDKRITIFIKKGVYNEKVVIHSWNTNIHLIGEDKDSTIIVNSDFAGNIKNGTFFTYTLKVNANDCIIENLTIINAAGEVGQAVALHTEADRVIIKNCKIIGNQDTVYAAGENFRQYYINCYIEGTTDYIFGAATAVFENCIIHSKKDSYITAASTPERIKYGFVFINCKLTADSNVNKVFLGRPWRLFAKTVFINCYMDKAIAPEGWHNWSNPEAEKTTYYAEYKNYGPGFNPEKRVKWSYQLNNKQIKEYMLDKIFSGNFTKTEKEKNWYKY